MLGPPFVAEALGKSPVPVNVPLLGLQLCPGALGKAPASSVGLRGTRMSAKVSPRRPGSAAGMVKTLPSSTVSARMPTTHNRGLFWGAP